MPETTPTMAASFIPRALRPEVKPFLENIPLVGPGATADELRQQADAVLGPLLAEQVKRDAVLDRQEVFGRSPDVIFTPVDEDLVRYSRRVASAGDRESVPYAGRRGTSRPFRRRSECAI